MTCRRSSSITLIHTHGHNITVHKEGITELVLVGRHMFTRCECIGKMEKYEKIRTVGRGAYGTVYLCRRIADKMLVIVKQICVDQMTKEERLVSLNESKVLSRLKHPNIIAYYENFLEEQSIVIVMEYAPGGTLYDYLQQREGKLLSEEEVLYYFSQIVLALHHVHSQQILHRDLKSHNILLSEKKNVIKIGDFGISKILSSKSKAYTVVGTPCYISPELCEGKPYNQKSDIWALGCTLYELLTLKRPFEATNLPALVMKIIRGSFAPVAEHYSKELRKLLLTLLDTDPNKRPTINQIMAYPIMITPIFSLYVTIGSLSSIGKNNSSKQNAIKQAGSVTDNLDCSAHNAKYMSQMSSSRIYCWGDSVLTPFLLPLPMSDTEITTVAIGENQKVGITKNGLLISWEVVGTPCYISPELCEGKPYNQKSDIWALGCTLYELLTLKRPFEATNLPALVMKIIRGSFAPVAEHYSKELRKLLLTLLDTDPNKRPTINQIMAYPIMITPIFSLYVTIGSLSSIGKNNSSKQNSIKQAGSVTDNLDCSAHNAKYMSQMSSSRIYCWGDSVLTPFLLPLPMSDTEITTVAIGENQKVGITKNGLLISWEVNLQ
ncbi:serine/threonine-protein kinase Nek8-like [Centruroides sculpturatus]|uniref:serine/threonine-protein kinase Nek8-like n=1 Tax=Centruroides sculpturatus TaxID=218467 RepID=UPI000C6D0861|nr:serine/threonine-protein kinase Nek8-like [Centruroides sculpturatus]